RTSLQSPSAGRSIRSPIRKLSSRRRLAPMSSSGSMKTCIDQLRAGDRTAAQPLWQDYFQHLVALAIVKFRARSEPAVGKTDREMIPGAWKGVVGLEHGNGMKDEEVKQLTRTTPKSEHKGP